MARNSEDFVTATKAGKASVFAGTTATVAGLTTVTTTSWSWWPLGWVASSVISWPLVLACCAGGAVISLVAQGVHGHLSTSDYEDMWEEYDSD